MQNFNEVCRCGGCIWSPDRFKAKLIYLASCGLLTGWFILTEIWRQQTHNTAAWKLCGLQPNFSYFWIWSFAASFGFYNRAKTTWNKPKKEKKARTHGAYLTQASISLQIGLQVTTSAANPSEFGHKSSSSRWTFIFGRNFQNKTRERRLTYAWGLKNRVKHNSYTHARLKQHRQKRFMKKWTIK